jgi:hypothetical protein
MVPFIQLKPYKHTLFFFVCALLVVTVYFLLVMFDVIMLLCAFVRY